MIVMYALPLLVSRLSAVQFFVVTVQPLPPTNVDVCVSFDKSANPTLQIQWQVSKRYHVAKLHYQVS